MDGIDPAPTFGEWLKRRRKALDLTQAELAQRAGCSVFALRKIESGERRPSKQLAGLLARSLEIPPEEQPTFIRVARGERNLERLRLPSRAPEVGATQASRPVLAPMILPASPTPFIGREAELAALGQLLRDSRCRLLTVVGPGGIGKTRLAIEVASRHQDLFPDGVRFVPLASLSSSVYLVPAIADALAFTFHGPTKPRIQLLQYLRAKQALLVLDNVEHLLDGVELFAEMLEFAPRVKLLVTSRERLNLQSEWVFEIQGLPVPPSAQAEQAHEYSSVALFVQRARRAQAGFEPSVEELPSVVRICQMVEGMPLGIELAAAWVSVLTCREIAHEIELSLDFLATSMRDVPERQRSLRAAFDHSWNLLPADERRVLCRLGVFRGGFEREAAEQVAGATLPLLLSLASKSLVRRLGSGRYDLHEVVRQYALSRLDDDQQSQAVRDRHRDFYLTLLRDRETALKSAAQREVIQELTEEIDNVRAGWDWSVQRQDFTLLGQALGSFGWLCDARGWLRQGVEQLETIVQALRGGSEDEHLGKTLGQALTQQGLLCFRLGQHDQAQTLLEESLAILRPIGDPALLPEGLILYGIVMALNGEIDRAQSLLEEGLACARAAGDSWTLALGIFNQGFIAGILGRDEEAYAQMHAGLEIWRKFGDPRVIALGLNFLSPTAIKLGRHEEAQALLRESLMLSTQVGDRWGAGTAYRYLGLAALTQEDFPEAQSLLHKSLDLFTELGTRWDVVRSLVYLGETAKASGDSSEARLIFLDALPQAMEVKALPLTLEVLVGLAQVEARAGRVEQAFELSSFVLSHPAGTEETRDRASRLSTETEAQLTADQIRIVKERSSNQSLETIVKKLLVDGKHQTAYRGGFPSG